MNKYENSLFNQRKDDNLRPKSWGKLVENNGLGLTVQLCTLFAKLSKTILTNFSPRLLSKMAKDLVKLPTAVPWVHEFPDQLIRALE